MKKMFEVKDWSLGRVILREDEENYYIDVGRRDLTINKKENKIVGSGTYVADNEYGRSLEGSDHWYESKKGKIEK